MREYIFTLFLFAISIIFYITGYFSLKKELKKPIKLNEHIIDQPGIETSLSMFSLTPTLILVLLFKLLSETHNKTAQIIFFNIASILFVIIFYKMLSESSLHNFNKILIYLSVLMYLLTWFIIMVFLM